MEEILEMENPMNDTGLEKPKRERSEKQKKAFEKARAVRTQNSVVKKEKEIEIKKEKLAKLDIVAKAPEPKISTPLVKEKSVKQKPCQTKKKVVQPQYEEEESESSESEYESDSSEDEIIIVPKKHKYAKVPKDLPPPSKYSSHQKIIKQPLEQHSMVIKFV